MKWFSEFSFADKPLTIAEVLTPTFFWLLALAVAVSVSLTLLEEKFLTIPMVASIDKWFSSRSEHALYVMRIGVGVTLVWSWQAGKIIAPELAVTEDWQAWLELLVAFLLVFRRTLWLSGVGLLALYIVGIAEYGFFHMLDYLLVAGVAWYFISVQSGRENIRITALPALYATLGFCLVWLGIEKLVYPSWSRMLLQEHPVLALGVDHEFFVTAAAMIEIGLGFMILVCLQERLLALFITLVFVLTTLVFGKEEVVGHTLIHTVLIVFLFAGPGEATPPLHWIKDIRKRVPATALAFLLITATLMVPYIFGSSILYARANPGETAMDMHDTLIEVENKSSPPRVAVSVLKDPASGWNIQLTTDNFEFAPLSASEGLEPREGEGHAHLMIDGEKVARLYSPWYHIPNLPPGKHEIHVTLNANNHAGLAVDGKAIEAKTQIEVLP